MSFAISLRSEFLKTRRTNAFWLSILGAGFIPSIFFLAYLIKPASAIRNLQMMPWFTHFLQGWQALSSFLFPMFIILICALIPQTEYKNNTWKQVFASPQSTGNIFFAKFATVHGMILLFYTMFNLFMIAGALVANAIHSAFPFFDNAIDWSAFMRLNAKTYIAILGISAIQFWLSLRFKGFIGPVGIGLALLVGSIIASGFNWEHMYKLPHLHPLLTLKSAMARNRPFIENHEWNSIGYFLFFTLVGFLDLRFRKERG